MKSYENDYARWLLTLRALAVAVNPLGIQTSKCGRPPSTPLRN